MEQGGGLEEKFNLTRERGRGDRDRQTEHKKYSIISIPLSRGSVHALSPNWIPYPTRKSSCIFFKSLMIKDDLKSSTQSNRLLSSKAQLTEVSPSVIQWKCHSKLGTKYSGISQARLVTTKPPPCLFFTEIKICKKRILSNSNQYAG